MSRLLRIPNQRDRWGSPPGCAGPPGPARRAQLAGSAVRPSMVRFFVLFAAAACASAQVTLSTVQGGVATPIGQVYSFGSVAAGWDVSDTVFNVSDVGGSSPFLNYFILQQGMSFSVVNSDWSALPAPVPAAGLNFTVRFQPGQVAASIPATLTLKVSDKANPNSVTITVILFGSGTQGFTVVAANHPLPYGSPIPFGSIQVGNSQTVAVTLADQTSEPLPVGAITLQGDSYQLAGASPAGALVPSGSSAGLQIVFSPTEAGPQPGALIIGVYSIQLIGTGLAPPPPVFPTPSIQLNLATPASAQQGSLSVSLASGSVSSGSGTVTLAFQSAVGGVSDDPTVTFADGTRSASFTVAEGASAGQFAGGPSVSFGTGTTAGTLVFTVTLGAQTAQTTITIPKAVVGIDAAVAARNVACAPTLLYCTTTNVQLQINGWDNTRSASQLVFTFFNSSGNAIAPGNITVAAASTFQQYFAGSTLAGVFGLHALFPVNGDSNQVVAALVQIINSVGTVESEKITF